MGDETHYDLVILGGGAATFAAITEASNRGLSTAMVNTGLPLGGTCVNVGCVPSKHLLAVSETAFEPPNNPFDAVQYSGDEPTIDALEDVDYETSETILNRREFPESIIVLGGGYIALEWGQILHRVGVDVTILQRSDRVLSGMKGQLGREMQRCFREEGIEVVTGNDFQAFRRDTSTMSCCVE